MSPFPSSNLYRTLLFAYDGEEGETNGVCVVSEDTIAFAEEGYVAMAEEKVTGQSKRTSVELPRLISEKRANPRWSAWLIPTLLTTEAGENLPATILNLSPTGLLALVDVRFAPALLTGEGMRIRSRFFLDDLEIRDLELEIVRVEDRGNQLTNIGCQFVGTEAEARQTASSKVDVLLTKPRNKPVAAPDRRQRRGSVQRRLKSVGAS